jgi:hypothetical protein
MDLSQMNRRPMCPTARRRKAAVPGTDRRTGHDIPYRGGMSVSEKCPVLRPERTADRTGQMSEMSSNVRDTGEQEGASTSHAPPFCPSRATPHSDTPDAA